MEAHACMGFTMHGAAWGAWSCMDYLLELASKEDCTTL